MVSGNAGFPGGASAQDNSIAETGVVEILLTSLKALAAAGEVEEACCLAGRACVILRGSDPAAARRFDVLLHRLTPALRW